MIELPLPPKTLSPNVRCHWGAKAQATASHRFDCGVLAKAQLPREWKPRAVTIDMEYRCSRGSHGAVVKDRQNAISATKALCDGLVDAGLIPNDTKRWLDWGAVTLITRKCAKGDGITITVRSQ